MYAFGQPRVNDHKREDPTIVLLQTEKNCATNIDVSPLRRTGQPRRGHPIQPARVAPSSWL
jgi:hypothetical protein